MPERMKPYTLSGILLLLVVYLGVQALTGQRGLLTGQANLTEVGGRIIATTMVEQELTLMSAGSDQAGKPAPRVDEADEAPAVLEGIEWSIGTESSESSGK